MSQSEIHSLTIGDDFHFSPDGAWLTVQDKVFTNDGVCQVVYTDGVSLHSHPSDHTPVWRL